MFSSGVYEGIALPTALYSLISPDVNSSSVYGTRAQRGRALWGLGDLSGRRHRPLGGPREWQGHGWQADMAGGSFLGVKSCGQPCLKALTFW